MTRFNSIHFLSLTILAAQAAPAPPTAPGVCGLSRKDPANLWKTSGAADYLNQFLKDNGDSEWSFKIDQLNSKDPKSESNLNCIDLAAGNCDPPPADSCQSFNPPALYHIRVAMASCHAMFRAIKAELVDRTLSTFLDVDTLVKDFGEKAAKDTNMFEYLSAAFGIVAVGAGNPAVAGGATLLGALSSIIGTATKDTKVKEDPTAAVNQRLKVIFDTNKDILANTTQIVFGGGSETSRFSGLKASDGETENIAKFFSGGKFLFDNDPKGLITPDLTPLVKEASMRLTQALVGSILKEQKYFIYVDLAAKEGDCSKIPASKWIDGQCFTIQRWNENFSPSNIPTVNKNAYLLTLDQDKADKMVNDKYKIDLEELYKNAEACQKDNPNYDGSVVPTFPGTGGLPPCFYNMIVFKDDLNGCSITKSKDPLPKEFRDTGSAICNKRVDSFRPIPMMKA